MRMINDRIAQQIWMRQHGQPALAVNAANRLLRREAVGNHFMNPEREDVSRGRFNLLSDDDDKLRQALAYEMRERDVVKVRDRNAAESAMPQDAPQFGEILLTLEMNVEIYFHNNGEASCRALARASGLF